MLSRQAILSPTHMVIFVFRWLKVLWFSAKTKWTFASSLVMPVSWAYSLNYRVKSLLTVHAFHTVATARLKLNSFHQSQSQMCSTTYPR